MSQMSQDVFLDPMAFNIRTKICQATGCPSVLRQHHLQRSESLPSLGMSLGSLHCEFRISQNPWWISTAHCKCSCVPVFLCSCVPAEIIDDSLQNVDNGAFHAYPKWPASSPKWCRNYTTSNIQSQYTDMIYVLGLELEFHNLDGMFMPHVQFNTAPQTDPYGHVLVSLWHGTPHHVFLAQKPQSRIHATWSMQETVTTTSSCSVAQQDLTWCCQKDEFWQWSHHQTYSSFK